MSFFDAEEAHAVMLAYVADRGGRAAFQVTPTPEDVDVFAGARRPPGSSVKSMLKVPARFGAKKDIHIPQYCQITQDRYGSLSCRCKAIIDPGICNAALAILWEIGICAGRHCNAKGRVNAGGMQSGRLISSAIFDFLFDRHIPLTPGLYLILFYPPSFFITYLSSQQFSHL